MNWPLELAVLIAIAISLVGTFAARHAALRLHWLDQPSHRKVHSNPIPLLGGIAIYTAFLVTILLTDSRRILEEGTAVLVGATLLLIVGIIDDQRGLRPRTKLIAQVAAALVLVIGGIGVQFTRLPFPWIPGAELPVTGLVGAVLNVAATILWVVAICNAMNLLDNMDGLSAGVAAIACTFFTLLAVWHQQVWVSIVAAVLLGAILGFLRFNWNPATIFMGDAGSLLLGFLLAVLALKLRFPDVDPRRTWPIPILLLAVPIFDTSVVTLSRLYRSVPISTGGRDHVSHRLVRLGLSVRQAVGVIYLVALLCGAAAVAMIVLPRLRYVYGLVALIAIAGLVALFLLERVDLSDTGQVPRAYRKRHAVTRRVGRVMRPFGVRRVREPHVHRSWGKRLKERGSHVSAAAPLWIRQPERTETDTRQ
jgi:UDP-GlcNAc:undecaprenyl-phosphate/decaprenyl-phosphate GlcNAc-1-phosphate transferase